MNLPKSGVSYNYSSGDDQFYEDRAFSSAEANFLDYRQKKIKGFNPKSYEKEKWLFDTPGVILAEQVRPTRDGGRGREKSAVVSDDQQMFE